uniref:Apoptotic chromatin condensation inducer in the nucleus n=1 Tax=Rhizophora mucronata TaxID=61149 RepID=A0A2P2MTH1_RHIMU
MGYSEKLNLDRSSGDDSMEYDVLESKQVDSKYDADEVGDRTEKDEVTAVKQENLVDIVGNDLPAQGKEIHAGDKIRMAVPSEKRKLNDQEAAVTVEPLKRQRRWNSEGRKSPETQSSNLTPTTTTRDASQPSFRHFSRSESLVTEDATKERIVPLSQKPPTDSLRIDHFLRPFTLKAVQELLGKTGTVTSFWMDHIKTHCYVTYSSVEEAIETRNAVYNLQWPPNGGRLLVAEFVDQQEVKMRLEAPLQSPAAPVTRPTAAAPALQTEPSSYKQVSRQHLPPPPSLPPPPLSSPPLAKERLPHPPPPPLPEKQDPPIVTLDDLFRKTKAAPRIYYLPLSEEQVAAKLAEQGKKPGSRD